jgi:hypothetical protein
MQEAGTGTNIMMDIYMSETAGSNVRYLATVTSML